MKTVEIKLLDSLFTILLSEIQTIEFGRNVEVSDMSKTMKRKVKTFIYNEKTINSEETDVHKRPLFICIVYKNGLSDFLSGDEETLFDIYTDIVNKLNHFL